MNLGMTNSLVIYDQKFKFFNFTDIFGGYYEKEVIIFIFLKKIKQLPYGFKNTIWWI